MWRIKRQVNEFWIIYVVIYFSCFTAKIESGINSIFFRKWDIIVKVIKEALPSDTSLVIIIINNTSNVSVKRVESPKKYNVTLREYEYNKHLISRHIPR